MFVKTSDVDHRSSRRNILRISLLVLLLGASLPSSANPMSSETLETSSVSEVRGGPWGTLEITPISISPMTDHDSEDMTNHFTTTWHFGNYTATSLTEYISSLGLNSTQQKALLNSATWKIDSHGINIHPTDEVIISLSPEARASLSGILSKYPTNDRYYRPWSIRTKDMAGAMSRSGLNQENQNRVYALTYYHDNRGFVSDSPALLNAITDREQKVLALRLLNSSSALLVNLLINPAEDIAPLLKYWGRNGNHKNLEPILDALSHTPGGDKLDISYLLPSFARERLYTYPDPLITKDGIRRDCHWSSLNFNSVIPDDNFGLLEHMQNEIRDNYYPVPSKPVYGDLVFFEKKSGIIIHSAVYLAANLVFTKNGDQQEQPWIIMDLDNLREHYSIALHEDLTIKYRRPRQVDSTSADELIW